jgi:methylmalonyl-CoA/ethylmalonyl-CoA epimerase
MNRVKKINHLAILVEDMQDSLGFWRDALGLEVMEQIDVPEENARVAFLPLGDSNIELVQPTGSDSGLSRYLAKRGPGLHHVCLQVEDIQTILDRLMEKGVRLINEQPSRGQDGRKYAFIHPESTQGVLVELYEL